MRLKLVCDYVDSSIFPAPFNFIGFLISWANKKRNRRMKTADQEAENTATATSVDVDYVFKEQSVEVYMKNEEKIKSENFDRRLNRCNLSLKNLESKLNEAIDCRLRDARQLEKLEELMYQVSFI